MGVLDLVWSGDVGVCPRELRLLQTGGNTESPLLFLTEGIEKTY